MSSFSFGGISTSSKKKILDLRTIKNCVAHDALEGESSHPFPIAILLDEYYDQGKLKVIQGFLEKNRIKKYIMLFSLNVIMKKEAVKESQSEGLVKFYRDNASDFEAHIPKNAVIITSGPSLYSLTKSDDIYPVYAQERIFGSSYFWYSPTLDSNGHWVYPIESFSDLYSNGFFQAPIASYKTQLARFQFKAVTSRLSSAAPRVPSLTKITVTSKEHFARIFDENKDQEYITYDLETSGFSYYRDRIGCLSWTFDGRTGYYANWEFVDTTVFNDALPSKIQIGANLKFDIKFLWHRGVPNARVDEDITVLGHILDETRSNSLKTLVYFYTPWGGYDSALEEYKRKTHIDNYLDIPEDILKEYAIMDALVTHNVFLSLRNHMKSLDVAFKNERNPSWTMDRYYREIRLPAINAYAHMEFQGVYVNLERLQASREKVRLRIQELQEALADAFQTHPSFNFDSTTALGKLLEEKGWEDLGRKKSGVYACADFHLERWAKHHPEAKLIQELRSCNVVLSTFLGDEEGTKGWSKHIVHHTEDDTWRMHSSYNVMGTESGRGRCSEPNMQNVPTHGVFAKEVKECLSTPNEDEYLMVTADYSALQLKLAAADSQDATLLDIFSKPDADIHSKTAYGALVENKEWDIEEIHVTHEGKRYVFLGGQIIRTQRGEIFARDLEETDSLL